MLANSGKLLPSVVLEVEPAEEEAPAELRASSFHLVSARVFVHEFMNESGEYGVSLVVISCVYSIHCIY